VATVKTSTGREHYHRKFYSVEQGLADFFLKGQKPGPVFSVHLLTFAFAMKSSAEMCVNEGTGL
jgi:hypothetical protein